MQADPAAPASFSDFNLSPELLQGLAELNFTQPTPVQALVLQPALDLQDVAGQAPTGSGKTAAYGLAILAQVDPGAKAVQAIVLVPARELALQVRDALKSLGKYLPAPGLRVAALYGGHPMRDEVQTLQQTPHVVVATPGRLLDHLEKRHIIPNQLKVLVLDEADKLLDLKFQEEMATIISRLPRRRQTLLFSATMPDKVLALVREYLTRPRMLTAAGGLNGEITGDALPASLTLRGHVLNAVEEKPAALYHLLQQPETGQTLIFANTRDKVEELAQFLRGRGVAAEVLHGKLPQPERDKALMKLRNNSAQALVATDVAARGIDVPALDTVIQYDLPHDAETFQHRAGRTARAGVAGTAHLLATPPEQARVQAWPSAQGAQWARLKPAPLPPANAASKLPRPETVTLHVTAGKKHKVSAHDLVGAFVKVGGLDHHTVGRIEVFDFYSYVAVPRKQAAELLEKLNGAKVKGVKVRVTEVA
ncbi:DEAD/DEAH box helicase [Hymenobacter cheonanensis]|uniref:DEAD/DEAH box helicase n=1 Tax=Hymenobacter sp. CA2-7 TaxID=3063993 RepID=UPI002712F0A5|nr:DEAD/DEAH box helicase [Hymenobacter sp. CA2-7]MDO7886761.1 DEAD/DEAH box helicase [Hymenobacter sp. CA2-7]